VEEQTKIDKFLQFLDDSGVAEILDEVKPKQSFQGGRPEINRYDLFSTILYGFAFRNSTLREMEDICKYDLRYISLMSGEQPSHVVFGNYINEFILPNRQRIFTALMRQIVQVCGLDLEDVFIDGTKIEANANKYKFVWKPTTYHTKLCDKVRALLKSCNLERGVPEKDIFPSSLIAQKLADISELIQQSDNSKQLSKIHKELIKCLEKALEYEEEERICGPDRNSYYKTDHDATAMTLKSDYYSGLGSNMHAAYNVQVAVCKGFAMAYHVSQNRNDIKDFVPTLEQFHEIYGKYPENVCVDSGYGSLENYRYMKKHHIGNYVKHQSWQGNASGKNPAAYRLNDDDTITCLNGKIGKQVSIEGRHPKNKGNVFYRITGCKKCDYRQYCKRWQKRKSDNFKIFEVNPELKRFIQQAEANLLSPKGIEIRVNRSCQNEGSYGVLKQDMHYIRFRRRSLSKVETEYMLTFLGYNIRKLFRYFNGTEKSTYWQAPSDLKAETFKKPSAKRLTNKATKKKKKSANEKAKTSYKYKK
jgi:transposase